MTEMPEDALEAVSDWPWYCHGCIEYADDKDLKQEGMNAAQARFKLEMIKRTLDAAND